MAKTPKLIPKTKSRNIDWSRNVHAF